MARIRSLKPTFWTDLDVAGLSRDARLLTIGLISHADDAGRFIATATAISGTVFPHDELAAPVVRRWRDAVAETGIIEIYAVDGREYGHFPNWKKHQKIYKPSPSTFPSPPELIGGKS